MDETETKQPNRQQEFETIDTLFTPTYRLNSLKLYNWGPFHRHHHAAIDDQGTAVIGKTGSGKTTLVDAFMTLICPQPKYNLASTGGHESDRDLVSYVRGVTGAGTDNSNEHITRQGKTETALEANFNNGSSSLSISALLWFDSSSHATSDMKRLWIFSQCSEYVVEDFLETLREGGTRAVKNIARNTEGILITENKKTYLARLNRFFEVNDNAFTLLNRAAGLKQINSIDDLFRDLVLEDRSAFERAAEVAMEFDDLSTIHMELQIARKQRDSLKPIETEHSKYLNKQKTLEDLQSLQTILPIWFALHGYDLWEKKVTEATSKLKSTDQQIKDVEQKIAAQSKNADTLRDIYMKTGGASIEQLENQLEHHQNWLKKCESKAQSYQQITQALDFDGTLSASQIRKNQSIAEERLENENEKLHTKEENELRQGALTQNLKDQLSDLNTEIRKVAASRSNIEGKYLEFQQELAKVLDLDTNNLPYAAELIEVKSEQQNWRGAIERAIGHHRLRLLVPSRKMHQALSWINTRHNRLHVRLLRVEEDYRSADFMRDGFTRKLNFKIHPYREAVKHLLANIDRHCVDDVETLDKTPHALTKEGAMSGKAGYFDKQDQRRLDQDWMTGFDNQDRQRQLTKELQEIQQNLDQSEKAFTQARSERKALEQSIQLLEKIREQDFEEIDVPGTERKCQTIRDQLAAIQDPDSDTAKAQQRWIDAKDMLERLRKIKSQLDKQSGEQKGDLSKANQTKSHYFDRIGDGLTDQQSTQAHQHFSTLVLDAENIDNIEREQTQQYQTNIDKARSGISESERHLSQQMERAKKEDTGALAETGSDLEDIPVYLERLRVLVEEGLPEKQAQFLQYLNESSDQGVTQLLMNIQNEVDKVREKIEELNHTMRAVDYQPGRYLRLDPVSVSHEILNTLTKAQQKLRYASTLDDEGESHYQALKNIVEILRDASERKRTKAAQALLDPRFRLQFSIAVIDRDSAKKLENRKGSQSGSGGEKEIIASYILTASLSYALCPDGSPHPLFGTVILDEAFSRSSQAAASRIISALREFGLHPLFITPNKELKLLRQHTQSAIVVHNKNQRSSFKCLSWEEIAEQADRHKEQTQLQSYKT